MDAEENQTELTPEQLEALESFVFKVSMEGFAGALADYFPKELPTEMKGKLKKLPTLEAEAYLEELMGEYELEYS